MKPEPLKQKHECYDISCDKEFYFKDRIENAFDYFILKMQDYCHKEHKTRKGQLCDSCAMPVFIACDAFEPVCFTSKRWK